MQFENTLAFALSFPSTTEALALCAAYGPHFLQCQVGLYLFLSCSPTTYPNDSPENSLFSFQCQMMSQWSDH